MKILGIVGSTRKGGNTDVIVDSALEGAKSKNAEVEKLYLRDFDIGPCQGGFTCEVIKKCVLPDGMRQISAKVHEAQGFVLGTPVHMGTVSSLFSNFLIRCRPFISYLDAIGTPGLSPEEEKALFAEKTCLELLKGTKPYGEMTSFTEKVMDNSIKSYYTKYDSHPTANKRLEKGKKGIIILCYGQKVKDRYPWLIDFIEYNLKEFL